MITLRKLTLKEHLTLMNLKDKGCHKINVEFSGSCDSGAIDDVSYYDYDGKLLRISRDNELDDIFYEMLDHKTAGTGDWVNNDGGNGSMEINLETELYDVSVHFYVTEDYDFDGSKIYS